MLMSLTEKGNLLIIYKLQNSGWTNAVNEEVAAVDLCLFVPATH